MLPLRKPFTPVQRTHEVPSPTEPFSNLLSSIGQPFFHHKAAPLMSEQKVKRLFAGKLLQFTQMMAAKPLAKFGAKPINEPVIQQAAPLPESALERGYSSHWVQTPADLRAAQALRWAVFAGELGARLDSPVRGLDIDKFDAFCEHLIVKDVHGEVVGTYRALLPEQAALACAWYSSTEFIMKPMLPHAHRAMEVGRSCVHPDHRNGTVMMMLWQELARFMDKNGLDWLFGCASVPTRADGGRMAASLWRHFVDKQQLDAEVFCKPRHALDVEALNTTQEPAQLVMPPLLKGYLRLGAKIASAPAHDEAFGCADFMILLRKEDISPRYAKHFFGQAAAARA